jgi:hypothetical protein
MMAGSESEIDSAMEAAIQAINSIQGRAPKSKG